MTKFTPGPWTTRAAKKPDNVGGYDSAIVAGNYIIAETYEVVADGVKMPVSANARLISSAPDLYEAGKALLAAEDALDASMARDVIPEGDQEFSQMLAARDEAKVKMRAALSKAEGGT